jgi:putative transposase
LHRYVRREGLIVNHKRVQRIYRLEGLSVRKRKRKRLPVGERQKMPAAAGPNESWSMDFVSDSLSSGRKVRCLTVIDDFTRESLAIEVDTSLPGLRVCRVLDRIIDARGAPQRITTDNGPEFRGKALDSWAYTAKIKHCFIRPGKPVENAFIESFNGRFRDECLNEHWFTDIMDARAKIGEWRLHYNANRPHSSLGYLTPEEFVRQHQERKPA